MLSVQLFEIPWAVAHQAPLSMGFPRQEYWSRLPFPSPGDLPDQELEHFFTVCGFLTTVSHLGSPWLSLVVYKYKLEQYVDNVIKVIYILTDFFSFCLPFIPFTERWVLKCSKIVDLSFSPCTFDSFCFICLKTVIRYIQMCSGKIDSYHYDMILYLCECSLIWNLFCLAY